MSVMSVSEVYSQADTTTTTSTSETVMGKDDFLTLLVAQLQNQDPLNPSDSTEFTAQLAQFSSLEQLQNINSELANFEVYQATLNNIQASNFIGKSITAEGNGVGVQNGTANPIEFTLSAESESVQIVIYDAAGNYVTDFDVQNLAAGNQTVDWDATDASDAVVDDGLYTFEIMAYDANGDSVATTSFTSGTVTGIDYEGDEAMLIVGQQEISIASVVRVGAVSTDDNES